MTTAKVMVLIGTRPEAIKLLPILKKLKQSPRFETKLVLSGQHKELLDQTLKPLDINIDVDLHLMRPNQSLEEMSVRCLEAIPDTLDLFSPDLVMVQGDTTTAFMSGLSSFFKKIPVAHIEAGLRTRNRYSPFPEEMNRVILSSLSELHFCPTAQSKQNLLKEGIPESAAFVTGNTSIDALREEWDRNQDFPQLRKLVSPFKTVLVTAHRRENLGKKMIGLFQSIRSLADSHPDFQFIYPVHPNPEVKQTAHSILSEHKRIRLLAPVSYPELVYLMRHSSCVLTDSGGIQEEAPTLGIHTLILRDNTERPEALDTGFAHLVGTDPKSLLEIFTKLNKNGTFSNKASWRGGPFGDGNASSRIVDTLEGWWLFKNRERTIPCPVS